MRLGLFRSATFRLALLYMGLFGGSVLVLLGFIHWSTAGYMARQTDATIEAEIAGLAERYRSQGLAGLTALIADRVSRDRAGLSVYLLADAKLTPLVGNLDGWPDADPEPGGWLDFSLGLSSRDTTAHPARARSFLLRGDFHLLVGRDVHDLEEVQHLIVSTLAWGLAITLVLALAGGAMLSSSMARRIEAINETSREIMSGDLDRRIRGHGSGDDFDQLVDNLNTMLDRIQVLMAGVREVSDNIAHDLRTPLTRLRNDLELVRNLEAGPEELRTRVEHAVAEADGLLGTFNALLRIARIESGARRAAFSQVDLQALAADVAELYDPLAEQHGQTLSLALAAVPQVRGDRDLLFQACANLLDNAIKYTPQGGAIELGLTAEARGPCLSVADDGPGVPPGLRDKVLQRFYRLETSRSTPGNGLGLSLVSAVARLHGAELRLQDNAPGLRVALCFGSGH